MPDSRVSSWLRRQRVPTARMQFHDLAAETRWLLGFAVLYVVAAVAIGFAISRLPVPVWGATNFTQDFWYVVVFKLVLLLTVPLVVFYRWGYRVGELLYGWRLTLRSVLIVVLCYVIGFFVNAGRLQELNAVWSLHPTGEAMARAAVGAALAFLMAGIPEEVVYRGLLQTRLEASWGRLAAILVSLVLFVAWHLPTRLFLSHGVEGEAGDFGSVLLGTGVPVGIVGLILAVAWDRFRNLPALIAIHAGIDTIPIVASMLQSTATPGR